jgi:hypothetical protein
LTNYRQTASDKRLVVAATGAALLIGALVGKLAENVSFLSIALVIAAPLVAYVAVKSYRSNTGALRQAAYGLGPLETLGLIFLCIGIITSSWNGLRAGSGLALCDVFLVLAAVSWLASGILQRSVLMAVPRWLSIPAYILLVDVLFSALASGTGISSLVPGIRLIVALLFTPLVIGVIAGSTRALWVAVDCWLISAGVNAAVAVSDYFGHTHIGESITGVSSVSRAAGLTTQSNHLAFVCVFALPIVVTRTLQSRSKSLRIMYAMIFILTVLALLASGSRGGAVGGAFVLASIPFFQPALRGRALRALIAVLVVAGLVGAILPPSVSFISLQRLTGASSAQAGVRESDQERSENRQLATNEFESSPVYGVGFADVRQAHNIYLQLLSAGGVIALAAFVGFGSGAIVSSFRFARRAGIEPELRGLAGAVCGTLAAWLLMGTVENQLYDRYLLVPCGLFVACMVVSRLRTSPVVISTDLQVPVVVAMGSSQPRLYRSELG